MFIWILVLNYRQLSSAAWHCDWERILVHAKRKKSERKSHSKSHNVQMEILHKKRDTFTIFAMNFVQDQLKSKAN